MNLVVNNSALLLDRWQTVELIDAAGATASLDKGCVWITMDGDRRDIMLGAGESWTIERDGLTLLQAEAPSTLRLSEPARSAATRLTLAGISRAFTDWVVHTFARISAPYY